MTELPESFAVGMTARGLWRGGGTLVIGPGYLLCTPGRSLATLSGSSAVWHAGTTADIYTARLVPPWFNVTVPVKGPQGTLVASMWIIGRRRLRRALRAAGFDVVEHRTWVARGFRWSEMGL